MFENTSDNRESPDNFYEMLNKKYKFTLDPCASIDPKTNYSNAKCLNFYTEEDDGLTQSWQRECVFCNPPYSDNKNWVKKCYEEGQDHATCVVMLIPARTDTRYWHEYVMRANEIHFVKGRLKFGIEKNSAPFPSAVVVFDGPIKKHEWACTPKIFTMERP